MTQRTVHACTNDCLLGFDAIPMRHFIDCAGCDESTATLFDGIDVLYSRDSTSRTHRKLYGPDLTPQQIIARDRLEITVMVVEVDERYELDAVLDMVERTRPWRCYD